MIPEAPPQGVHPALTPTCDAVLQAMLLLQRECGPDADEAAVADLVVRTAATLVGADQGTLGLVRDGEVITIAAFIPPRQTVGSHFPVGFGVAGWVAATGRPATIADVREDKRYVALPYPEVRSFVGVPLQSGSDLVGVLSLAAWRSAAFAPEVAEMLAPLAEQAALLLRRAEHDRRQRERLQALEHSAREGLAESLHELKAPLHAAAGFLDLVVTEQVGPLNERQRDFLTTARDECGRLKDALALLVEAGVAGQRLLPAAVVSAQELVSASAGRVRGQALQRGVRLIEAVDQDARAVSVDMAAIQQVLSNFLQNALRVAPPDSELVVSASSTPEWTTFAVADRGPGVPPEQVEALFDRFRQGAERERAAGEVGLGLAIARRIIEQHRGRIWAENRPGGGSRFCFQLPTARPESGHLRLLAGPGLERSPAAHQAA